MKSLSIHESITSNFTVRDLATLMQCLPSQLLLNHPNASVNIYCGTALVQDAEHKTMVRFSAMIQVSSDRTNGKTTKYEFTAYRAADFSCGNYSIQRVTEQAGIARVYVPGSRKKSK